MKIFIQLKNMLQVEFRENYWFLGTDNLEKVFSHLRVKSL